MLTVSPVLVQSWCSLGAVVDPRIYEAFPVSIIYNYYREWCKSVGFPRYVRYVERYTVKGSASCFQGLLVP